jgi:hypothetical protein
MSSVPLSSEVCVGVSDTELINGDDHEHAYELVGSGLSHWAECVCGDRFARANGPVVGSRSKVLATLDVAGYVRHGRVYRRES